ncbi:UNVERIFIED_CONTAM: hypothetical protein Sangu_0512900 [Sesamum angustifolium]|uniref:Uncharacterized protein n=1 Tax=Sesamum angustifolium TaxID=2727405 RepID=A0AAW2Q8W0_9LAMI
MEFNKGGEASTLISHELSELSKTQTQRSIYRVHKYLRNVNSQCYEPNIVAIGPYHSNKDNLQMTEEHKLRYLQLLLERKKENVESTKTPCHNLFPGGRLKYKTERSPEEIKHILDLVHGNWIPSIKEVNLNVDEVDRMREWRFIHSATELTNANVAFQKKLSDDFFKVEFDDGLMQMPPLNIEDRTECFFRNLIAYEQYFQDSRPNFVTDYVKLLDSLINSSEDIDILCKCEIIDNWLGDNEVVANIFNRLTLSVTGHQHFVYTDIFDKVNAHYGTRRNKAIATLRRDYFNSPWAYFSFLAALAILSLTVAQTVFSALQVF